MRSRLSLWSKKVYITLSNPKILHNQWELSKAVMWLSESQSERSIIVTWLVGANQALCCCRTKCLGTVVTWECNKVLHSFIKLGKSSYGKYKVFNSCCCCWVKLSFGKRVLQTFYYFEALLLRDWNWIRLDCNVTWWNTLTL